MAKPSWLSDPAPKKKLQDDDLGLFDSKPKPRPASAASFGSDGRKSADPLAESLGLGASRPSSRVVSPRPDDGADSLGPLKKLTLDDDLFGDPSRPASAGSRGPMAGRRAGGAAAGGSNSPPVPASVFAARCQEIKYTDLTLGEEISGGGFCILYRGTWGGSTVAIKRIFDPVLTAELMEEFHNEVAMLSELKHPNVVNILAMVSKPPSLCIVTEYMARGSVYHVLHQSDVVLNDQRTQSIASQVATAYQFIHNRGVIHRDIKSHNMLSDANLGIRVCDFGLARTETYLAAQKSFDPAGTPPYMAPEIFARKSPSRASDVYALGIFFWELVHRDVPFDGMAPDAVSQAVQDGRRPEFGRAISPAWKQLITSCWQKDIAKRPTADGLVAAIKAMA